ncbi:MAG: hypothetical protein P8Y05_06730 [Deinococcales bacterium]
MKRTALFVFVTAAMLLAGAMAGGLPQQATVEVVNDQGVLVGTGSVHDGALEVELTDAAVGFATLLVSGIDGRTTRLQAVVPIDGSLHIVDAGGVLPARAYFARSALAFELHSQVDVEASNVPAAAPSSEEFRESGGGSAN